MVSVPEATAPAPAPIQENAPGSRPDHTVASICVMLALSAGALYLADWLLREDGVVVQAWDLSQPVSPDTWAFPDSGATQTAGGMTFEMEASGFGPKLNLSIPAESVRRIQASIRVTHAKTGKPVPFALGWYWARAEDLAASPDEPFSPQRSMVFYPFARHRPHTYRTDIHRHDDWQGDIKSAVFTIKFPDGMAGPFRVTLSGLEFLE